MSWKVEQACEQDIPAWLELAQEVGDLFGTDMASDPAFQDWLTRNIARGDAYCVHSDGEFAGAMQYRRGWINWLAVHKRFRHRGIGRALVIHAISSGDSEVCVTTFGRSHPHPDSDAAQGLYGAMGFVRRDETPTIANDGTPRTVLIWRNQ